MIVLYDRCKTYPEVIRSLPLSSHFGDVGGFARWTVAASIHRGRIINLPKGKTTFARNVVSYYFAHHLLHRYKLSKKQTRA